MFGSKPMFLSPGNEFKALIWTSEVCSRLYKPCTRWATPISAPLTRCAHGSIMFVSIICHSSVTVWSHTHRAGMFLCRQKSIQSVYSGLRCAQNPLKLHYIQLYEWSYPFLPSNQSHVHVIRPWLCVMDKVFGPYIHVFVSKKWNFKALMKASNACSILLSKARTTDRTRLLPLAPSGHVFTHKQ